MKKGLVFGVLLASCLMIVTGCGGKKETATKKKSANKVLHCTNVEEQTGMKNTIDMSVEFKNDTAYKMNR